MSAEVIAVTFIRLIVFAYQPYSLLEHQHGPVRHRRPRCLCRHNAAEKRLPTRNRLARGKILGCCCTRAVKERRLAWQDVADEEVRVDATDGGVVCEDEACVVRAEDELAEKYEGLLQTGRAR